MKLKVIVLIFLFVLSSGSAATENLKSLENELIFFEWSGPEIFFQSLLKNKKTNPCEFLASAEKRYQQNSSVVRRILLSLGYSECLIKKQMAEKYLKSNDPLLRGASVRLASSLSYNQRKEVEPRISELKATDRDPAVVSTISEFFHVK
jgi:hypothetical protein